MVFRRQIIPLRRFEPAAAKPENVRLAALLHLPFRLRVPSIYSFSPPHDPDVSIHVNNKHPIPTGTTPVDVLKLVSGLEDRTELWSDVLIILKTPRITSKELGLIREGNNDGVLPVILQNGDTLVGHLNAFLVAYAFAAKSAKEGQTLAKIRDVPFLTRHLCWEAVVLCPQEYVLSNEDVRMLFDLDPMPYVHVTEGIPGPLDDLTADVVARIPRFSFRNSSNIAYELAFEAEAHWDKGELIQSLVLACAALEAAHAALLRDKLTSILGEYGNVDDLVNRLLREQGIYTLLQLTPPLLMGDQSAPTPEQIGKCKQGLELRNDIMHAKRRKSGTYKIRERTGREIRDAALAVAQVCLLFLAATEDGRQNEPSKKSV